MIAAEPVLPGEPQRPLRRFLRGRLTQPPGLLFYLPVVVALLWTIAWTSSGGADGWSTASSIMVWFTLSCAWLLRLVVYYGLGGVDPMPLGWIVRWLAGPVIAVLVVVLMLTGIAFDVRFTVGEPALRSVAQAALRGEDVPLGWHGVFEVRHIRVADDRVTLRLRGGARLVWSPSGRRFGPAPGLAFAGTTGWSQPPVRLYLD